MGSENATPRAAPQRETIPRELRLKGEATTKLMMRDNEGVPEEGTHILKGSERCVVTVSKVIIIRTLWSKPTGMDFVALRKLGVLKVVSRLSSRQFSSVQFSSRWYLRARNSPYALHPVSQKFPQRCLGNGSNVRLTDDGPLSSFQGRSSSASSFHASLFQAISGVMSLALCPQVMSQVSQHLRSSEKQVTCEGCFARQSICSAVSLHSGRQNVDVVADRMQMPDLGVP